MWGSSVRRVVVALALWKLGHGDAENEQPVLKKKGPQYL